MSNKNQNPAQNQDPGAGEHATREAYKAVYDTVEQAVFFGGAQEYRETIESFGARMMHGRLIEQVSEQPQIVVGPIWGNRLAANIPEDEAGALQTLHIAPGSTIELSFAADCDERNYQTNEFEYRPGSVVVAITSPDADDPEAPGLVLRTYEVKRDQSTEPYRMAGSYDKSYDTIFLQMNITDDNGEGLEDLGEHDPSQVAVEATKKAVMGSSRQEAADEVIRSELGSTRLPESRQYLTADEAAALKVVATYIDVSGNPSEPANTSQLLI